MTDARRIRYGFLELSSSNSDRQHTVFIAIWDELKIIHPSFIPEWAWIFHPRLDTSRTDHRNYFILHFKHKRPVMYLSREVSTFVRHLPGSILVDLTALMAIVIGAQIQDKQLYYEILDAWIAKET